VSLGGEPTALGVIRIMNLSRAGTAHILTGQPDERLGRPSKNSSGQPKMLGLAS